MEEARNNTSADERTGYYKIIAVVLSTEIFAWLILLFVPCFLRQIIPIVVFVAAVMLITGKIKNRFSGLIDIDDGNE